MLFSIFDTETTGLTLHPEADIDKQPRIIEFGGIVTDGKSILEELEFKVNPGVPLEAIITKITGLTDDDLKDKPSFAHYVPTLRNYFMHTKVRVAHNLAFDRDLLYFDCERAGFNLETIAYYHPSPVMEICTVEQSFFEYGRAMKLQELIEIVKGEYVQKHRALDDVLQLFDVARFLGVFEVFA
jgi:DNA polymerase III epsilon subunit-like protein